MSGFTVFSSSPSQSSTSSPSAFGSSPSLVRSTTATTIVAAAATTFGSSPFCSTATNPSSTSSSPFSFSLNTTSSSSAPPGFSSSFSSSASSVPSFAFGSSEALSSKELGAKNDSGVGLQAFSLSSIHAHDCSPQNRLIIQRILGKYGDITEGSMIKTTAGKFMFLKFVADTVNILCNHTMETLNHHELLLMEMQVADAIAVGFNVEWLQRRVDEVVAASRRMELAELSLGIESAKKYLAEMEQRHMVLSSEVATIKARLEGKGLGGSSLCEGLL